MATKKSISQISEENLQIIHVVCRQHTHMKVIKEELHLKPKLSMSCVLSQNINTVLLNEAS